MTDMRAITAMVPAEPEAGYQAYYPGDTRCSGAQPLRFELLIQIIESISEGVRCRDRED
jgi:hypothetical protein